MILRELSMYKTLTKTQIFLLHPGREHKVAAILKALENQRRITVTDTTIEYIHKTDTDIGMIKAVWVLTDFIANTEYHTASEFPAKLSFFSDGKEYAVVYAETGKEALISRIIRKDFSNELIYIVIVDSPDRISALALPESTIFCTVTEDGRTNYYKTQ